MTLADALSGITLLGPVHSAAARLAADLRARYSLRTPDAIQVATAIGAGCMAFLTNDRGLRPVMELRILVLEDLTL
jgi:predicted nucleic acid-binding protein